MEDLVLRVAMLVGALAVVGRIIIVPTIRWFRAIENKVESIDTAVGKLATVDQQLTKLEELRLQIEQGLEGMQRIVASDEDRVSIVEHELAEVRGWERSHMDVHRQIDARIQSLENERRTA